MEITGSFYLATTQLLNPIFKIMENKEVDFYPADFYAYFRLGKIK